MTGDPVSGAAPIKWSDLKPNEKELAEHAAIGKFWTPKDSDGKPHEIDPANPETRHSDHTIRAHVIRRLAVGDTWPEAGGPSTAGTEALLVRGAFISGELDLRGLTLKRDIWLEKCVFDHIVQLSDCRTKTVSFRGSRLTEGLRARRTTIKGSLYLNDGFVAGDEVNLEDVTITRNLECAGGSFCNKSGADKKYALFADNAKIGGDARLKLADDVPPAINFVATGEVRIAGATIAGDLYFDGGSFHNSGKKAIVGGGLSCRNLYFRRGFLAEGAVDFIGLRTQGQVACIGGTFSNKGKDALVLRYADIGSALLFNRASDDPRKINDNETDLEPASIDGTLDLSQAKCRAFRDCEDAWPKSGKLLLDGFTYECFYDCKTDSDTRRKWLQCQKPDRLNNSIPQQPWTQAVSVLRDMGYEKESIELAIYRERALAHSNRVPISLQIGQWKKSATLGNPWKWLLWAGVGYGYRPGRALWWSLGIFLFSWLTFALAGNLGYMAPREGSVVTYLAEDGHPALPEHYTQFNALVYAADVYLPVIELRQNLAWEPGSVRHGSLRELAPDEGWFDCTKRLLLGRNMDWRPAPAGNHRSCGSSADSGWLGSFAAWPEFAFRHGFHRFVYWFEEILGWIFITLLLAGMSGIMKKE